MTSALLAIFLLAAPAHAVAPICTQRTTGLGLCIPKTGTGFDDWGRAATNAFELVNSSGSHNSTSSIHTADWLQVRRISGVSTGTPNIHISSYTLFSASANFTSADGLGVTHEVRAGSVTTSGVIVSSRQGSATLTDITQAMTWAGLQNVGSNLDLAYRPLVYGSFSNSNTTKPQVGIWWRNDNNFGTSLYFGTSNSFATGITKTIQMDYLGNLISGSSITTTGGLFGGSLAVAGSTLTVTDGAFTAPSQPFISLDGAEEDALPDSSSTKTRMFWAAASTQTAIGWGSASSGTVTFAIAGLYDCYTQVAVQPASLSVLRVWLNHNGVSVANQLVDPISGGTSSVSTRQMILAAVNDTVTVDIAASGATSIIEGDDDRSFLQCAKLR